MNKRSEEPSNDGSPTTTVYTIETPPLREKVRSSFDIYKDQRTALGKLQLASVDAGNKKPILGDMIQEAIDWYVKQRAKQLGNVRLKQRTKQRS